MIRKRMIRERFGKTFACKAEVVARAPGRIEFIGNHTDYNGGSVLGATIDRAVHVALAAREDNAIHLVSTLMEGEVVVSIEDLTPLTGPGAWANYPLGVLKVMLDEGISVRRGFNLLAESDLPVGAGMSSSAALEVASAYGILALNGLSIDRERLVILCRRAENEFVGVPCGILDQGVSAFGGTGHLVHIDCWSLRFRTLPLPSRCRFWMFDSGKKHALIDSKYAERHGECQEALRILKGARPDATCLARLPSSCVREMRRELGETYYRRALHVTEENRRVAATVEALRKGDLEAVGQLLVESHESSRTLFENSSPELDALVELLSRQPGVLGARLCGGGFGGAVMALTSGERALSESGVEVQKSYARQFGRVPTLFKMGPGEAAGVVSSRAV